MKKGYVALFLFILTTYSTLRAQDRQIDSIRSVIKNAKYDTIKVRGLISLTGAYYLSDLDTAMKYCREAIVLAEKTNFKEGFGDVYGWMGYLHYMKGDAKKALEYYDKDIKADEALGSKFGIGIALNNMGLAYNSMGDYKMALEKFNQSLEVRKAIADTQGMSGAYNNIGLVHYSKGDISKALDFFVKGTAIKEKTNDKLGLATCYNNVAAIYYQLGDIIKSLEFNHKSLQMRKDINDKRGVAVSLNNIGSIYEKQGEIAKGLEYYHKSLKEFSEMGDEAGIADLYGNLGALYGNAGDPLCKPTTSDECKKISLEKALEFFNKELAIEKEINDQQGMMTCLINMGGIYKRQGNFEEASRLFESGLKLAREIGHKQGETDALYNIAQLKFESGKTDEAVALSNQSLKLAKELGFPFLIRDVSELLSKIYKKQNKPNEALAMYELYVQMRDSINNTNTRKSVIKKQYQYEYEQKEAAIRLEQEKQNIIHQEELKQRDIVKWSSIGILSSAFLSSLLLFNRHRLKQKNKFQEELNQKQKEQASAVMEIQEQERKRIAEDLHDSLGHLLSTAKLNLQTSHVAEKQIENSLNLLNQASEEIRNITFNLMPRTLEEGGLVPALNELATKVNNSGSVKINLHVHDMEKFILEKQSQFNIYRIVQEAVNNILKHADASEINIQLIGQLDHITIMIEDDGRGFNPDTNKKGRGLKNIVTRSLWLKGNINIDSTPGKGTTITTEIPV